MTLREARCLFSKLISQHVLDLNLAGYEVALDQVKRTLAEAEAFAAAGKGIRNSLHLLGLAADLNMYKGGKYLKATEDHRVSGDLWKTRHPLCRWGGDFGDGNHYSIEWEGRK